MRTASADNVVYLKGAHGESLLSLTTVSKRFGAIRACCGVNLDVREGEIRGILGENGAGKSTLMKLVCGLERPDSGVIRVDGEALKPGDAIAARTAGVAMVHQHLSLVGSMSVWRNVSLGERHRVHREVACRRIGRMGEEFGLEVDPLARVDELDVGERQRTEILKCLWRDPKVIILDEPTSLLDPSETHHLFEVLRRLTVDRGRAVVLISHRLEEIVSITDHVTIMREGSVIDTVPTAQTDASALARLMLGRGVAREYEAAAIGVAIAQDRPVNTVSTPLVAQAPRPSVLEIRDLTLSSPEGPPLLDGLTLTVHAGEILGIAGVEGNGQASLVDVFSHLISSYSGTVRVCGEQVVFGPGRSVAGVGVIPFDRHDSGCVLTMSVSENLIMGRLAPVSRFGVLRSKAIQAHTRRLAEEFQIHSPLNASMWTLSGGNQQRVVLARELSYDSKLLIVGHPTRGLDIGAMGYVWQRIEAAAQSGAAILLISPDLSEVLRLAHRVSVIYRGRIVGEMPRAQIDLDRLGELMGGQVT